MTPVKLPSAAVGGRIATRLHDSDREFSTEDQKIKRLKDQKSFFF